MIRKITYIFLLLIAAAVALTACQDEPLLPDGGDSAPPFDEGYSVSVVVTLDKMGGMQGSSRSVLASDLEKYENYIDPEKLRVLFFDYQDRFLFESKSRWVKRLGDVGDHTEWLVSVPFYTSGNDVGEYEWSWDSIRKSMTLHPFKVAVMANRPSIEWNLGIVKKYNGQNGTAKDDTIVPFGWFGSDGPYWTAEDSWKKDIFDLHFCQYDPIYDGKNRNGDNGIDWGMYDIVSKRDSATMINPLTGEVRKMADRPWMGAVSSWVRWDNNDRDNKDPISNSNRIARLPDESHPIPMYGIQAFNPITHWVEGTPFNLSTIAQGEDDGYQRNSISLLRSVVKLELLVPTTHQTSSVLLYYTNIYARCEPMNIWTPTDSLWLHDHPGGTGLNVVCEEARNLKTHGLMTSSGKYTSNSTEADIKNSRAAYQKKLAWIYGAWLDKGWNFGRTTNCISQTEAKSAISQYSAEPPKLFNPCTQRNSKVYVEKTYSDGTYDHFIAYVGERNINDPTDLTRIGKDGTGDPTIIYWAVGTKTNNTYNYVGFPLAEYNSTVSSMKGSSSGSADPSNFMGSYLQGVQKSWDSSTRADQLTNASDGITAWPWPLLRNHIYRIKLGSSKTDPDNIGRSDDGKGSSSTLEVVSSEDLSSPTIRFSSYK